MAQIDAAAVFGAAQQEELDRLKQEIPAAEARLQALYAQIGAAVCGAQPDAQPPWAELLPEAAAPLAQAPAAQQELEQLRQRAQALQAARAANTCPSCGAAVRPGTLFCTSCGAKLPERGAAAPTATARFCRQCGAPATARAAFCTLCGAKLE